MRRKDREVTNPEKIKDIIRQCHCCRLGFYDDGQVYIVPLSFGYIEENHADTFYFHSAKEGRKIDLIAKNSEVGFELDTNYQLHEANVACRCSAAFQSIIGSGKVSFVLDKEEKRSGLSAIMEHNTGKREWSFDEGMLETVCVFKLTVKELSCKEHL